MESVDPQNQIIHLQDDTAIILGPVEDLRRAEIHIVNIETVNVEVIITDQGKEKGSEVDIEGAENTSGFNDWWIIRIWRCIAVEVKVCGNWGLSSTDVEPLTAPEKQWRIFKVVVGCHLTTRSNGEC